METNYVCLVKMGEKYGLMMTKDGQEWVIHGFKSEAEGVEFFEASYRRAHKRSYEGSMSASINYIFYQPSIVKLSIPEIEVIIEERRLMRSHTPAGGMDYLPLISDKAQGIWEAGTKPTLIKDEWLR